MKPIKLSVKTSKFKFSKDVEIDAYKKLIRRVKREYKADECYLHDGKIVIHRAEVVGTWKSKRIDGANV